MQKAICPECHSVIDIDSGVLSSGKFGCIACMNRTDGSDLIIQDEKHGECFTPENTVQSNKGKSNSNADLYTFPIQKITNLSKLKFPGCPKFTWITLNKNDGILEISCTPVRKEKLYARIGAILVVGIILMITMIILTIFLQMTTAVIITVLVYIALILLILFTTAYKKNYIVITKDHLTFKRGRSDKNSKIICKVPRSPNVKVKYYEDNIYVKIRSRRRSHTRSIPVYSIAVTDPLTQQEYKVIDQYHVTAAYQEAQSFKEMIETLLNADFM